MFTTLIGTILIGILIVSLPALATRGDWHLPGADVSVVAFLCSWLVISASMKRMYSIQFYEEVLDPKERAEYEEKLNAKPEKVQRVGMFLVDLNNGIRSRLNRITKIERVRSHRLIFPYLQSLFVLLAPTVFLFWSLYVFNLTVYTEFSAISAPIVIVLASAVWSIWHVKGGFTRVIGRRNGRIMEPTIRSASVK